MYDFPGRFFPISTPFLAPLVHLQYCGQQGLRRRHKVVYVQTLVSERARKGDRLNSFPELGE